MVAYATVRLDANLFTNSGNSHALSSRYFLQFGGIGRVLSGSRDSSKALS